MMCSFGVKWQAAQGLETWMDAWKTERVDDYAASGRNCVVLEK